MRRVVITGMGVRAPGGDSTKGFWDLLTAGRTATRRTSFFDPSPFRSQVAAEVEFCPEAEGLTAREIRRMDRATQLAVASAAEAVTDSGLDLDSLDPHRVGVVVGSAVAAATSLEEEYLVLPGRGSR